MIRVQRDYKITDETRNIAISIRVEKGDKLVIEVDGSEVDLPLDLATMLVSGIETMVKENTRPSGVVPR